MPACQHALCMFLLYVSTVLYLIRNFANFPNFYTIPACPCMMDDGESFLLSDADLS